MIVFSWLEQEGFQNAVSLVYKIIDLLHILVPIGLIIMTTFDIFKKIIDPNDKEGQSKIMRRAIAGLIVFLLPTIINIILKSMNLEIKDLSNAASENTTTTLYSINITNCPNAQNILKPGMRYTINTDIPASYKGEIKWIPRVDHNAIKIISGGNSRSVTIEILPKPSNCFTDITVSAGNVKSNCVIVTEGCGN